MKKPQQGKDKFYIDTITELEGMDDRAFNANADAVRLYYYEGAAIFRVPTIKHASVNLTSKLFVLEKSKNIEAPYVISITDPSNKGHRIDVPLNTSRNSLRRLDQYGAKHSVDYTIRKDGCIKVTVAFEKKHIAPEIKDLRGVDVGTNDALHTSDDVAFGSFDQCAKFYDEQVLPLAGVRSSILNKKRAIKHYLHTHSKLPDDVKKNLRNKMDRLEAMLRRDKEYDHRLNHYQDIQRREIKTAVNDYIESLHGDKSIVTALELLDIKEFDKSKKVNRKLSNFARGSLTKTLIETLNWNGYTYIQVEPAYTSQECPVCHFTLKENRNGKVFHCKCCGFKDDADHVGALNIVARADDTEITEICENRFGKQRHNAIHALLDKRHEEWLKEHKTEAAA